MSINTEMIAIPEEKSVAELEYEHAWHLHLKRDEWIETDHRGIPSEKKLKDAEIQKIDAEIERGPSIAPICELLSSEAIGLPTAEHPSPEWTGAPTDESSSIEVMTEPTSESMAIETTSEDSFPGKCPKTANGALAVNVAWELEKSLGHRATAKEVMAQLITFAKAGVHGDVLKSAGADTRSVEWITDKGIQRNYGMGALGKTLAAWKKSRSKTESKQKVGTLSRK